MPVFAAIDLGTNSVRLLVAEVGQQQRLFPLVRCLRTTRLGEGVNRTRWLKPEAMQRTLEVLREYQEIARSFHAQKIRTVATSAVRDALNRDDFLALVREKLALEVEVASGEEEAYLSYLGVLKGTGETPGRALVIDLGGGSTEFIAGEGEKIVFTCSVNMGAVRMAEEFFCLSPGECIEALERMQREVRGLLRPIIPRLMLVQGAQVYGVGGTLTTLAALDQRLSVYDPDLIQGYDLSTSAVQRITGELSRLTLEERRSLPGLQPERADIIVAGAGIVQVIMEELHLQCIKVSEADILHGIIYTSC